MDREPNLPLPIRLKSILIGRAVPYTRPGTSSAIAKHPSMHPLLIASNGLEGDEQGDLRVHGGPDKAIHHYPLDHYAAWDSEIGPRDVLTQPGAFGENFSALGWTESDVCIGDVVTAGEAVLELSQGRQPCWKLNDRFEVPDMAARVQASGRTGWYYRVLQPGRIAAGDELRVSARPHPAWPLRRLMALLHSRELDQAILNECLTLPLTPSWRRLVEHRLQRRQSENWTLRLDGPAIDE